MKNITLVIASLACGTMLIMGCGTESVNQPTQGTVALKVAFDLSSDGLVSTDPNNVERGSRPPIGNDPDSVTITGCLALVRSVRFVADPGAVDTVITAADEQRDLGDASVRFQGPYVLSADGTVQELASTSVPTGQYSQLRFVLQKARTTDNLGLHPELLGSSVRVTGTVWHGNSGASFTYSTDLTTEVAVNGSYNVSSGANSSLSLQFRAGRWFYNANHWLDPTDPANRLSITRNIGRNILAQLRVQ